MLVLTVELTLMWDTSQLTQCLAVYFTVPHDTDLGAMYQTQCHVTMPMSSYVARVKTSKQSVAIIFEMYRAYSRDHPQSLLEPLMPTQPRQERCQVQSQHLMGSSSEKYAALVKTRPQVMISLIIITQSGPGWVTREHFHLSWDLVTAEEMMGSVSWFLLWIMTGNNLCCVHPLCDKIWRIMVIKWKQSTIDIKESSSPRKKRLHFWWALSALAVWHNAIIFQEIKTFKYVYWVINLF